MKKIFLFLCLVLTATMYSQVKVRPGAKLGLNLANLTNSYQSSNKIGVNGGLFVNVHLSKFYELQVETTYSEQGAKFKFQNYNTSDPFSPPYNEQDLNLDYISLSIANKLFPVKNNGFNLIVGPSIDILVSDKDYSSYYLPIDFSLFAGIGYELPFGLGLEIRYKHGLLDVRDSYNSNYYEGDDYYDGNNVLNRVIQIGATYKFDF